MGFIFVVLSDLPYGRRPVLPAGLSFQSFSGLVNLWKYAIPVVVRAVDRE